MIESERERTLRWAKLFREGAELMRTMELPSDIDRMLLEAQISAHEEMAKELEEQARDVSGLR